MSKQDVTNEQDLTASIDDMCLAFDKALEKTFDKVKADRIKADDIKVDKIKVDVVLDDMWVEFEKIHDEILDEILDEIKIELALEKILDENEYESSKVFKLK